MPSDLEQSTAMTPTRRFLFTLVGLLLPFVLLAFGAIVVESISAATLYVTNRNAFDQGMQQHWLFSDNDVSRPVYRRDHRGKTLRRDPIPFDPYTVWRFSEGNVFWGLEVGKGGYIKNNIDTNVTYRPEANWHVYVVGGSTVAGAGATDNRHTIAANLERILHEKTGKDVNVVNAGVGGWWSRQEVSWFVNYLLQNHKADDVIFLNGYNDSWRSLARSAQTTNRTQDISGRYLIDPVTRIRQKEFQAMESRNLSTREALRALGQSILRSRIFSGDAWFTSRLLFASGETTGPSPIAGAVSEAQLSEMRNCAFEGELDLAAYESAMRTAAGAASAHGVNLYYVLQPSVTFKATLVDLEKSTLYKRHRDVYNQGWKTYGAPEGTCFFSMQQTFFRRAGEITARLDKELGSQSVKFLDLSALFHNSREDIFYDYAHYTDLGNEEIALALSRILLHE